MLKWTATSVCWYLPTRAELFKAGLRWPRVSARFEFRYESLKTISVLILFVCKLIIESFKNNRENYPRKCFWTQEKETWVKFNPGLSANRPSNNLAQRNECKTSDPLHGRIPNTAVSQISPAFLLSDKRQLYSRFVCLFLQPVLAWYTGTA